MQEPDQQTRNIVLDGGVNFRDLGGYETATGARVRWRRLFRSGNTHALSNADRGRLAALGIRAVVDLRSVRERDEHPHGLKAHGEVEYNAYDHHHGAGDLVKMLDDPRLEAVHMEAAMLALYRDLPYQFAEVFGSLLRAIAFGPLPLVFNCTAGKDRTGVAAALLLGALEVAWEDIVAEYLLSEHSVPAILRSLQGSKWSGVLERIDPQVVAPLFTVKRAYLEAMRESVTRRSGSIDAYLADDLRLDAAVFDALRRRLLQ
jgi:protein-tyrosine phosphatase